VSPAAVYVHVGLPKTGTTYIQSSLWASRSRLAGSGWLVPGEKRVSGWRAASDLLGRRPKGAEAPQVSGAWEALVEAIGGWDGHRAIFSEELLVVAGKAHLRRLVKALQPADVHVVVTVRDLARVLPSVWQQEVKKGRTWTWEEFIAAVRNADDGPATAAAAFWMRFDLPRILQRWEGLVPPDHIHVALVPPAGSPDTILLHRFAEAVGIDPELLEEPPAEEARQNSALGVAEVEALRRLNVGLAGQLNERQYARSVVQTVIPVLQRPRATSRPLRLPAEQQPWVDEQSQRLIEYLRSSGFHVVGPLEDLAGSGSTPGASNPGDVQEAELVDPMTAALVGVCTKYAQHWWQRRHQESAATTESNVRLASGARALSYQAKASLLEKADDNKVIGRLARMYLKRGSGGD
jgi:hypothetical protein